MRQGPLLRCPSTSRFSKLFEPVKIGPVTAPNRFYQVPHCNGLGWRMPKSLAAMRAMKAAGGWGVVSTEETEIHHSSDLAPYIEGRLWEDADIPMAKLVTTGIKKHGALAACELVYSGPNACNYVSRTASFGVRSMSVIGGGGTEPGQCREASTADLQKIRAWHRAAALRAKAAGFDIIYVYAAHGMSLPFQLLSKANNTRSDHYGGPSLENRTRFLRELIEDTKQAVGDTCAVAVRFAVDELAGPEHGITHDGEARDVVGMLAELPDLWDVNISGWSNDSQTSRFAREEGYQEPYIQFVKTLTTKPVVGVGRYTTPDAMLSAVNRGVLDLIGAARPSIADPFLPKKIKEGRFDDIRECIGCNICVSCDNKTVPIRCTQNPTMGEEWRRGWHPEEIDGRKSKPRGDSGMSSEKEDEAGRKILVVGGGPAGLEAARALGQRGYCVELADQDSSNLGGRAFREAQLPGLKTWRRVSDWRQTQIQKLPNVTTFLGSEMSADAVLAHGAKDIIIATGAKWRSDGIGRTHQRRMTRLFSADSNGQGEPAAVVCGPEQVMGAVLGGAGGDPRVERLLSPDGQEGHIVIFDDDHYYMGSTLAEAVALRLSKEKKQQSPRKVHYVTPASTVAAWSDFTLEQRRVHLRLSELGVVLHVNRDIASGVNDRITLRDTYTGSEAEVIGQVGLVALVTDRLPNDGLYKQLLPALQDGTLNSLRVIGDAEAPHIIAQAVFSGHRAAQEFDEDVDESKPPFRRE